MKSLIGKILAVVVPIMTFCANANAQSYPSPMVQNLTVVGGVTASSNKGALSYGTLSFSDTNVWESWQTSVNSYAQAIWQNTSGGATASTSLVLANDLGTATTYYGEFGINSSGFTGTGSLNLPNATYLTATSGDLVFGTTTANGIHFVVNNGTSDALTISAAGLITATGQISTNTQLLTPLISSATATGVKIVGSTNGVGATAGSYGEYQAAVVPLASAVAMANSTIVNIASLSLTAGDWQISGLVQFGGTTAVLTAVVAGINTTSAVMPIVGTGDGASFAEQSFGATGVEAYGSTLGLPPVRLLLTATTTVYLNAFGAFASGTLSGYGQITARRMR
jgi:hypothetical protein